MRIAYKGIFFLYLLFQLFFASSLFANIKDLESNYKSAYISSEAEIVEDEQAENDSDSVLQEEQVEEVATEEGQEIDLEQQYLDSMQAVDTTVIIVDKFSPKDDLEAYRRKYLINTEELGTARFFSQESMSYRDLERFAVSVSANIVLFKSIDFSKKKDAEFNYYYDIKFLADRAPQEGAVQISPSQDIPWKRTSEELENFSAPTSMFQFFDKHKRILVKEQSRIMIEYGLKTQKEFDDFIKKYTPKQEATEQVIAEQVQETQAPATNGEAVEGQVADATVEPGQVVEASENGQVQEAVVDNSAIVAQVVEDIEKASEHDILGLRDFYFTTLEGRWVDIASGNVFDIIALTDYTKDYQGYEKYDDKAPRESLYDFDSAKKSITQYSPASLQEERKYVVYTAYYVGNALDQVKEYNSAYAKLKGEKTRFNYLERTYNRSTVWENEDFVLEFNTKSQDGVYLTENKVPMPANFKAFPHRGYITVQLSNGDTRYLLPLQIAEDVDLPLPPQPKEPEYDEDGNLIESLEPEEEVSPEGYYDPYIYDSRFNKIVYLDKVPFYRTAHIARGEVKKQLSDSYIHFLIPIIAIFTAITIIL